MSFTLYRVDFTARPVDESIDIRKRIDRVAYTGYAFQHDDVRVGEFTLSDESELDLLQIPDWAKIRQI